MKNNLYSLKFSLPCSGLDQETNMDEGEFDTAVTFKGGPGKLISALVITFKRGELSPAPYSFTATILKR